MPSTESGVEQMSQTHSECPFSIQIAIALPLPSTNTSVHSRLLFSVVPVTKMDCTHTGKYLLSADGAVIVFTFLLLFSKPPINALDKNPLLS